MNFKRSNMMAVAMAMAAIMAGCTNPRVGTGLAPAGARLPGQEDSVITKSDAALLNVLVDATAKSGDAAGLASKIKQEAEAAAIGGGFTVSGGNPDVSVDFDVALSQFDAFGNYYVLEGAVPMAKIALPAKDGKVVASTAFSSVKSERVLGKDKAAEDVAAKLMPAVRGWMADNLAADKMGLEAKTIVVQRRTIFYKSRDPIFVKKFVDAVAKIDGVLDCRYVAGDATARIYEFRVVYDKDAFPAGLVQSVITTCKKLDIEIDR